jgi:hypothetical protein
MQKLVNVTVDVVSGVAIVFALTFMIGGFQTDMTPWEPGQKVVTQDLPAKGDTWLANRD